MGTRIIGPRPWLGPGIGGDTGGVDDDGNPVDPYGGPTTGDVVDGIREVVDGIHQRVRGEAKSEARTEPRSKAREVDCSEMPDETACNECLLKQGHIAPPTTPRYVAQRNLINYEYQLYIANLRSALPMNLKTRFPGYKVWSRAQSDIERVLQIWQECLSTHGGPYLFGERSMADAMYAPVVTRLHTYDVRVADAACAAYCTRIMTMPELQEWIAAARLEPEDIDELEMEF